MYTPPTKVLSDALEEVKRLDIKEGLLTKLNAIFNTPGSVVQGAWLNNEPLKSLLQAEGTHGSFFSATEQDCTSLALAQIIAVDIALKQDAPHIDTVKKLHKYTQNHRFKWVFNDGTIAAKFLNYLDFFEIKKWIDYAQQGDGDWSVIHALGIALPYCHVDLGSIFKWIAGAQKKNPRDLAIYHVAGNIEVKLKSDPLLGVQVLERINEIVTNASLNILLPYFLSGAINESGVVYKTQLPLLIERYHENLGEIIYALGVACPNDADCISLYKIAIDQRKAEHTISTEQYIKALSTKNYQTPDVITYLSEVAVSSADASELLQLLIYLQANLDLHLTAKWYREMVKTLVKKPNPELVTSLNYLFYRITQTDPEFVYELFTCRFSAIGEQTLLKEPWYELVNKDIELFGAFLTDRFNHGNRNTHRALLHLCTVSGIPADAFRLPTSSLATLSSEEKLYIAYKISGYIYSREQLQSLMFSLIESVKDSEIELLRYLFDIFFNYIIYNYRSTLDPIKEFIQANSLPSHLIHFYKSLEEQYEHYFQQLNLVKNFIELNPDTGLRRHINFYTQQVFSEKFNAAEKTGLAALFKNSPIHSHRFAVRRPEEKVHQVVPLGHIQSSMEFPSGEKLNPIFQERLRHTYQNKKKHEISFS